MRDYLTPYIGTENPINTYSKQVPKVPKPSSGTFGTASRVCIPTKNGVAVLALVSPETPTRQVPKVTKPPHKVWRPEPYYPPCEVATALDSKIRRQEADSFYAALALKDGHEPETVIEMLRKVSPAVSTRPDYCRDVVSSAGIKRDEILTSEMVNLYLAHHPFRSTIQFEVSNP